MGAAFPGKALRVVRSLDCQDEAVLLVPHRPLLPLLIVLAVAVLLLLFFFLLVLHGVGRARCGGRGACGGW